MQPQPQFSVPQIEYPLGGSNKTSSHVYFLLKIDMVSDSTTIVVSDCTIVTSGHHGSIRKTFISNNSTI